MLGYVAVTLTLLLSSAGNSPTFKNAMAQLDVKTPANLERALSGRIDEATRAAIVKYLNPDQLKVGTSPKIDGKKVGLGIRVAGAKSVEARLVPNGPTLKLKAVGDDVYAGTTELSYGDAFQVRYFADGKQVGEVKNLEVYDVQREMKPMKGVIKGELIEMPKQTSKIYPNTQSEWWVYKPAKFQPEEGYGLIVFQDGQWAKNYAVTCLDNLIAKGDIPPVVAVFIKPSEYANGNSIRMRQYDYLTNEYSKFLLEEYLPVVESSLKLKLTKDPAKRCVAGLSSGGICAFTAAWERPDSFGLVLSWIGSFTNIASQESKREGGHNYPALIRKIDKKPIRVYLQDGDQDLDNEHGNWFLSNKQMEKALLYKGYDVKTVWGHGFHSDPHGRSVMPDALRWLFSPDAIKKRR